MESMGEKTERSGMVYIQMKQKEDCPKREKINKREKNLNAEQSSGA